MSKVAIPTGPILAYIQQNPDWLPSVCRAINEIYDAKITFVSASQAKGYPPAFTEQANGLLLNVPLSAGSSVAPPSGGSVIDVQARAAIAALLANLTRAGLN